MDSYSFRDTTISSYSQRAKFYEKETDWVHNNNCVSPFVFKPFGSKLAFDACAGTGAVSKELVKNGWIVVSCDKSKDMLEEGRVPIPIIGDIHSIPSLDNHFDLVVCRQGLQYTNLDKAIGELVRICKGIIVLGHITTEVGDNTDFWENYFKIASPERKHIFKPGDIEKIIAKYRYKYSKTVIHQQDNYLGPILHLSDDKQSILLSLLTDSSESFKKLYSVTLTNNKYTYSNRWEFIKIEL